MPAPRPANALTALKSGVRRFDATLGGVDGVVALEDVLHLFEQLEVAVPADRAATVRAARRWPALWGAPAPGPHLPASPPHRRPPDPSEEPHDHALIAERLLRT